MPTPFTKRCIGRFHVVSPAVDVKEMYQEAWCTCRAVVLLVKRIVFWRCRCRRGSCLSSLTTQGRRSLEWTISCKSLYFVHRSLELVPLVAFECRLRGSNFCELITILSIMFRMLANKYSTWRLGWAYVTRQQGHMAGCESFAIRS